MRLTVRTKDRGAIVAQLEVGDRLRGRIWRIDTIRNHTFATRWNCSKMFLGSKVKTVYFPVDMKLLGNKLAGSVLPRLRIIWRYSLRVLLPPIRSSAFFSSSIYLITWMQDDYYARMDLKYADVGVTRGMQVDCKKQGK